MSISPLIPDPSHPDPDPTTRWRLVEELFHRASELPPAQRPAFLEQVCADNPSLIAEVLDLLHSDADVADKVEAQKTPTAPPDAEADHLPFRISADSWLNRRLGHYLVEHELGRGGMGVVYLGRRATPGPHPQAAIKVVRRNLQDSPALNHFLLERDALARLEHPNIARLLDGGVTPEGIPWLALEYVQGQRLDHHVEALAQAGELSVPILIGLLLQLCAAVAYVHRNLILHRDLKPGNVMVTLDGARGHTVKLLDFGTLKILATDEDSAMTQAGMRPVTLRFASPEHVRGQRVSTASDVYSLGIILYRLLAGRFPEPPESIVIPSEPSTSIESGPLRHSVSVSAAEEPAVRSAIKPIPPPESPFHAPMSGFFANLRDDRLAPPSAFTALPMPAELARDLDAIVMKAIRHNPQDRYQTAEALAAELTRALENQPVEARGNNRAYLARKFYARHAVALWTAAAACLILFAALLAMAHETRIAHAQQANAEMGVDQERKLAKLLLFDITPRVELISTTQGQKGIVTQVSAYLDRLNTGPNPDPELQLYQIQGYNALSNILGNPYQANLGDTEGAIRQAEKAIALAQPLLRRHPDDLRLLEAQLNNESNLGGIYLGNGEVQPAASTFRQAEALESSILSHPALAPADITAIADLEDLLGDLNWGAGRATLGNREESSRHERRALQFYNQALTQQPGSLRNMFGIEYSNYKLGTLDEDTHPELAIGYFQAGLLQLAAMTPEQQQLPRCRRSNRILNNNLAGAEADVGLVDQGLTRIALVREQTQATFHKDPTNENARAEWLLVDANIGALSIRTNHPKDAVRVLQEGAALAQEAVTHHPSENLVQLKALILLFLYVAATDIDDTQTAARARDEGMPILLGLAAKPSASPSLCLQAAHFLNLIGGDPAQDLAIAQRAMLAANPGPDEYIERAVAEERTGNSLAAQQDATKAATFLVGTTGGFNQFRKEEIRRILHQPPLHPDPSDHGPIYQGKAGFQSLSHATLWPTPHP